MNYLSLHFMLINCVWLFCQAVSVWPLPSRHSRTRPDKRAFQPGSVPALSATRKLIEQPNNFLVNIFKKCKGSGLFYGPLAVGGSLSGMGLFGHSTTGCQLGFTMHPWGTFFFSCCFPCPCVCVHGGGEYPTIHPWFPAQFPGSMT